MNGNNAALLATNEWTKIYCDAEAIGPRKAKISWWVRGKVKRSQLNFEAVPNKTGMLGIPVRTEWNSIGQAGRAAEGQRAVSGNQTTCQSHLQGALNFGSGNQSTAHKENMQDTRRPVAKPQCHIHPRNSTTRYSSPGTRPLSAVAICSGCSRWA